MPGSPLRRGPVVAAALAGVLLLGCKTGTEAPAPVERQTQAVTSCSSFTVTTNTYNGSQWWGTITFRNNGPNSLTSYKVEFDVPSGKHCTAEPESVPPGATLTPLTGSNPPHTTSNHCVFTWTNTSPLAPGASKTFNYSTDTQSMSSASNVAVTDTACGVSCSMAITANTYNGSQWWGTITFKNQGTSPASSYSVEFDVPSGKHCTAEAESVPAGAELSPLTGSNPPHTVSNHCVFTWAKGTSIPPGGSKTFNYSTDTQSMSSASNVVAMDLACGGSTGPGKGSGSFPPGTDPPKANPPEKTAEQVNMEHPDASMPPPATIPGQVGTTPKVAANPAPPGSSFYGRVRFQFQGTNILPVFGTAISSPLNTSETLDGLILVVGKMNGTATHVVTLRDPRVAVGSAIPSGGHSLTPSDRGNLMVNLPQAFIANSTNLQNSLFQFYALPSSTPHDTSVVVGSLPTLLTGATLLGEVPGSALMDLFFEVVE